MLIDILWTSVNAVLPIVLMIALGYFLRKTQILNDSFLKAGKNLVFKILLPCSLFVNIYQISGLQNIRWNIAIFSLIMILLFFVIGFVVSKFATRERLRKGVIWQGAFRSNFAIIGIPLATILGGEEGAAMAAVLSAFAIPLYNICSVSSLTYYVGGDGNAKKTVVQFVLEVLKNPLTIGVFSGLAALALRGIQIAAFQRTFFSLEEDIPFLFKTVQYLKSATTPLALIVLGGQCEFSTTKGMFKELTVGTLCRIVVAPAVGIGLAVILNLCTDWFPCSSGDYAAMLALFGSPVAVSSAIVASAMGNDEQLASQLVVWTSLGSMLTIFAAVCIMLGTGLLIL